MEKELIIKYEEYSDVSSLAPSDAELVRLAEQATFSAYSPYSLFRVGAALRLRSGKTVCGSNQENGAYPSGLCAERTAIFAASAQHPEERDYEALAIVGRRPDGSLAEASPCGACRQVLAEYEQLQGHPLRVLCLLDGGRIRVARSVQDLLPFSFSF